MKRLLLIPLVLFLACEDKQEKDCAGVERGTAFLDDCGICSGGTTNHIANSDFDTTYVEECGYQEVCNWQSINTGDWFCSSNSCYPGMSCLSINDCQAGTGFAYSCDNTSYCQPEYEQQYICSYQDVCIDVPVTSCP